MRPLAPQLPGTIKVSSMDTRWSGFPLEVHRLPARGESPPYAYPHSTAFLYTSGETTAVIAPRGQAAKRVTRSTGMLNLRRRGWAVGAFEWKGYSELELLAVQLCPSAVAALGVGNVAEELNTVSEDGFVDRQLAALMIAMQMEVEGGCPSGAMYSESLSLSLAMYAAARYSGRRGTVSARRPKALSSSQLARVSEYVKANIGRNLRLFDLAALLDVSPHHFAMLFRNAAGMPPHQYVICERIRMARALLKDGRDSISDIAIRLGFSSHSHFCETFKRHTGQTPRRLR